MGNETFLYCVISFANFRPLFIAWGRGVRVEILKFYVVMHFFRGGGGQSATENELLIIIKLDVANTIFFLKQLNL